MMTGKIIIYGLGKIFGKYHDYFNWGDVIAVTDQNVYKINLRNNTKVIGLEEIAGYYFDYIVVCTGYKIADEIYCFLTEELSVPIEKIVSVNKYFEKLSFEMLSLTKVCRKKNINYVYDPNDLFYKKGVLSNSNINGFEKERVVWGKNRNSDTLLIANDDLIGGNWEDIKEKFKYILVIVPVENDIEIEEHRFEGYTSHVFHELDMQLVFYEKKESVSIYVVTHKEFSQVQNDNYKTLWVGERKKCTAGYQLEVGENIARLNIKINECTGLYWIWKHSHSDIVGLNHYRRYFKLWGEHHVLKDNEVKSLLCQYDMILAEKGCPFPKTNEEDIKYSINNKAFEEAKVLVENAMKKYQPDYMDLFVKVMKGFVFYPCNMFITRKEIMNSYCEWLFSIIIPAAESFDNTKYDEYSQRAVGFLAERLLTVWMLNQEFRVKELPILYKDHSG